MAALNIRRLAAVTAACLVAILMTVSATASSFAADDYTYMMKVSAGNNGELVLTDGSTASDVTYKIGSGQDEAFPVVTTDSIKVTNDKYTVIGFKEAGRDTLMQQVPQVTGEKTDLSYVAVYGVKSGLVKYTVRYLDDSGNPLMDDAVYYGPQGGRVMVSFKYIEGYAPTAYNLTRTLGENGDDNVLAFRYYSSNITAEEQAAAADNANANANANANPAAPANAAAGANAAQAAQQAAAIDAATPGTPDVVDLDEGDVPLAGPDATATEEAAEDESSGISPAVIAGAAVAAAAVIAAVIAIIRRRSTNEDEDLEEDE